MGRADLSFGDSTRVVLIATTHAEADSETLPPLPEVAENVERLSRTLGDPDVVGLEDDKIIRIIDCEHASDISARIASAGQEARDTFVVYYAGHGLRGDETEDLYLCSTRTTDEHREFDGVGISKVRKAIAESPAQTRILILDCCFAGAGLPGGMASADVQAAVQSSLDINGTYGIAAVPANRKAQVRPGEPVSAFTGELIDVMEKGIPDKPEVLKISDIMDTVRINFHRKAEEVPVPFNRGGAQNFLFARNRFFDQDDLAQLKESVEGLRATVANYGLRVQTLEDRLEEVEARPVPDPQQAPEPRGVQTFWERFGLTEEEGAQMPQFVVDTLLDVQSARRTGSFLVTMQVLLLGIFIWAYSDCVAVGVPFLRYLIDPDGQLLTQLLITLHPMMVVMLAFETLLCLEFFLARMRMRRVEQSPMMDFDASRRHILQRPEIRTALRTAVVRFLGLKVTSRGMVAIMVFAATILGTTLASGVMIKRQADIAFEVPSMLPSAAETEGNNARNPSRVDELPVPIIVEEIGR